MKHGKALFLPVVALSLALIGSSARGNNLAVKRVSFKHEAAGSHVLVQFDLSWEDSWRTDLPGAGQAQPYNYDAAWVFLKYSSDGGATWQHATLSAHSSDHQVSKDNGIAAAVQTVPDGKGLFLFRAANGAGAVNWQQTRVRWNYSADGLTSITPTTVVKVLAVEMVYLPAGSFQLGDPAAAILTGQFERGTTGEAFEITSEDALTLGGGAAHSLGNNNAQGMAHKDDFDDHLSQSLPAAFPKGHAAFYVMKYEITQGQYADFLNLLRPAEAARRTPAGETDYSAFRGTIKGAHPDFEAVAPDRACNFLSWQDGAAYADWAALRPMTELEFEKACRGKQDAVTGEYAWGNTHLTKQTGHNGADGSGSETAAPANANANFGKGINGPVRGGIYAAASAGSRVQAGAALAGVMELSGNLWERVVTVGSAMGRHFTGTHGDGLLTTAAGKEGSATNADWPGRDANAAAGITGAQGSGSRGGAWTENASLLRVADRACAATPDAKRVNNYGFRCVRTAP